VFRHPHLGERLEKGDRPVGPSHTRERASAMVTMASAASTRPVRSQSSRALRLPAHPEPVQG
jgi:hypothetical protein